MRKNGAVANAFGMIFKIPEYFLCLVMQGNTIGMICLSSAFIDESSAIFAKLNMFFI
jgi:hypothetical protein